jgi:ribosomal protein S6
MSTENADMRDDRQGVYEIGYLIGTSIPEEKVPGEAAAVKKIITDAGASVIAEEAPRREDLAYTIRTKNVSGSYESYDQAYFGWIKFELASAAIEAVKKAVEKHPTVIRMLLLSTVRESTYLGKRAMAAGAEQAAKRTAEAAKSEDKPAAAVAAPASIVDMDKSIDALVKEA